MNLRYTIILFCMLAGLSLTAGDIVPVSMRELPMDMTGQTSPVRDKMGRQCALVKVNIPYEGAVFDGVIHSEYRTGVYFVWIEDGNKMMEVRFPNCVPRLITFGEHMEESSRVKAPHTYELNFDLPALGYKPQNGYDPSTDIDMEYAIFSLNPKPSGSAIININGTNSTFDVDGKATLLLPYGTFPFSILADGYATYTGQVTVSRGSQTNIDVALVSNRATLSISAATPGTTITMQGEQKSSTGTWSGELPAGSYKIEASKDAHVSYATIITLESGSNKTLEIPALTPITVSLPVNVSPNGSLIKIDGREVGHTPYIIRDLLIGSHTIEVTADGYEPYTATLSLTEGINPAPITASLEANPIIPENIIYDDLSLEELTKLAENGLAEAQFQLGCWHTSGYKGATEDYSEVCRLFHKAADQGHAMAMFFLANYYAEGIGVTKSAENAHKYMLSAALHGCERAYYCLYLNYYNGIGVAKNYQEALKWVLKDYEIDQNGSACFSIGKIYEEGGYGVTIDRSQAIDWYLKVSPENASIEYVQRAQMHLEALGVRTGNYGPR